MAALVSPAALAIGLTAGSAAMGAGFTAPVKLQPLVSGVTFTNGYSEEQSDQLSFAVNDDGAAVTAILAGPVEPLGLSRALETATLTPSGSLVDQQPFALPAGALGVGPVEVALGATGRAALELDYVDGAEPPSCCERVGAASWSLGGSPGPLLTLSPAASNAAAEGVTVTPSGTVLATWQANVGYDGEDGRFDEYGGPDELSRLGEPGSPAPAPVAATGPLPPDAPMCFPFACSSGCLPASCFSTPTSADGSRISAVVDRHGRVLARTGAPGHTLGRAQALGVALLPSPPVAEAVGGNHADLVAWQSKDGLQAAGGTVGGRFATPQQLYSHPTGSERGGGSALGSVIAFVDGRGRRYVIWSYDSFVYDAAARADGRFGHAQRLSADLHCTLDDSPALAFVSSPNGHALIAYGCPDGETSVYVVRYTP
jgi:hypothetical protein